MYGRRLMSKKELEAFNFISEKLNGLEHYEQAEVNKHLDTILQVLTPPTEEEVCEALEKHTTFLTAYNKHEKEFFDDNGCICYLINGRTYFNDIALPPHLITLIGRFYEGVEYE